MSCRQSRIFAKDYLAQYPGSDEVPIRDCSIESPSTCIFSTASKFFPGLVFLYSVETVFPNFYLFHTQ